MKLSGAQIIWESLLREGVETVFGYPGGAVLNLYDALLDYPAMHHVLVRHEQGGCHAADGYARASGKVGVCIATSGPGATNLVTGLATAMLDSVPMVAITGQVQSWLLGSDAFQEVDVTGITLPITKHNYLVQKAADIAPTIREAFALAMSGRQGPVLVDITKDAQKEITDIDWDAVPQPTRHLRHLPPKPSRESILKAMELLKDSKRPLILAGRGIQLSGARQEVLEFAQKANIPIATTLLAIGSIPASHPLNLGMMGMHGEAWTNQAIQEADLLLAFGMRFDDRVTGDLSTYAQNAKKIHIEIDQSEIHKNVKVDAPILGDVRDAVQDMLTLLEPMEHKEWLEHINELRDSVDENAILAEGGGLHAPQAIHDLWKYTGGNTVVVSDVGQHQMWEAQYYKHDEDRSLITSGGLGTMGFALPAAMGAKFACPGKDVWVIAGDGGIQMNIQELMTLTQEGIKVNIAVINNGFLGMVRQWQELFYDRRYAATPMISPDFVKLAEAYGLKGRRVTQRSEIESAVKEARETEGSYLIEFVVDQEYNVMPMVPAGGKLDQMIRR